MNLVLASQSPRRKELLGILNIPFSIRVPQADEKMDPKDDPARQVGLVSQRKALAARADEDDVIVAADTIVVCQGEILGKPKDEQDAYRMLEMLSGRSHQVMTGLTVLYKDRALTCTEITDVFFRPLSAAEIRRYVASKDPMDKAGSYGIQSGAAIFVEKISGDYFNVVGLPLCRLARVLTEIVPELMEDIR